MVLSYFHIRRLIPSGGQTKDHHRRKDFDQGKAVCNKTNLNRMQGWEARYIWGKRPRGEWEDPIFWRFREPDDNDKVQSFEDWKCAFTKVLQHGVPLRLSDALVPVWQTGVLFDPFYETSGLAVPSLWLIDSWVGFHPSFGQSPFLQVPGSASAAEVPDHVREYKG